MSAEEQRAASLRDAEKKAIELFNEIEKTLIRPGISEKELNNEIHALGAERHGVRTHWHKRWEADFGRTFVLGNDPNKIKLRDALEPIWIDVKAKYCENPDMTGEELYNIAKEAAEKEGFEFGAPIAGHIVGSFPHERIPKDKITLYIAERNSNSMNTVGKDGNKRHWILEIHLHNKQLGYGRFYEQLLTA
nr:hypothetical protein FVER53263_12559 [Fusarium verticillioides]